MQIYKIWKLKFAKSSPNKKPNQRDKNVVVFKVIINFNIEN